MIDDLIDVDLERRLDVAIKEIVPMLVEAAPRVERREPFRVGRRIVTMAAAVVVVAVGVAALWAVSSRSAQPTTPANTPVTTVPNPTPSDEFVGQSLDATRAPLVTIDQPDWLMTYLNGTEDLPLGDVWADQLILVGQGPRFDAPWFRAATPPAQGYDLSSFGTPIEINGNEARIDEQQPGSGTTPHGPAITLIWPLSNERVAYVSASGLERDHVVAMAEAVDFGGLSPEIDVPDGFTRLDTPVPSPWLLFEYAFTNGDRTFELHGSNLGAAGLLSQISLSTVSNRNVNGVDVGLDAQDVANPGSYRADWLDGSWAYYATGVGFASDDDFLATIADLRVASVEEFEQQRSAVLGVILPGADVSQLVQEFGAGVALPDNMSTIQWPTARVATSQRDFAFRLYLGLGCGWKRTWVRAADAGDTQAQEAAAAAVDSIATKAAEIPNLAPDQYTELASWMRAGDREQVSAFGSNDCPTWSETIG